MDERILHLSIQHLTRWARDSCYDISSSHSLTFDLRSVPVTDLKKKDGMKNEHLPPALPVANFWSLQILPNATRPYQHNQRYLLLHKLLRIWTLGYCFIHFLWTPKCNTCHFFFFFLGRPGQVLTGCSGLIPLKPMRPQEIYWHLFLGSCCSKTKHGTVLTHFALLLHKHIDVNNKEYSWSEPHGDCWTEIISI